MVVVLIALAVGVALLFASSPSETASLGELLDVAVTQVVLGPAVLAVVLVVVHRFLTRDAENTSVSRSILAGAALGALLGGLWSLAVPWGIGVALLGALSGAIYGTIVGLLSGRR
jgi:hypothetical protein